MNPLLPRSLTERRSFSKTILALGGLSLLPDAFAAAEQQKLVAQAETSFRNFLRDPEMTWFQHNMSKARAVLIAPEIVKAGFIIGGSGGKGVLVAKDSKSGVWRGPVFYTLATGSIGFQAGIQVAEAITMVMTQKGVDSLLSNSMKVGADASIAAGPVGVGTKGEIVTDMIGFSRAKGLYGGLNFDGTAVTVDNEANQAYFSQAATPADILVRGSVSSKGAANLLAAVRTRK